MATMSAAYMREYRARRAAIRNAGGFLPFQACLCIRSFSEGAAGGYCCFIGPPR